MAGGPGVAVGEGKKEMGAREERWAALLGRLWSRARRNENWARPSWARRLGLAAAWVFFPLFFRKSFSFSRKLLTF